MSDMSDLIARGPLRGPSDPDTSNFDWSSTSNPPAGTTYNAVFRAERSLVWTVKYKARDNSWEVTNMPAKPPSKYPQPLIGSTPDTVSYRWVRQPDTKTARVWKAVLKSDASIVWDLTSSKTGNGAWKVVGGPGITPTTTAVPELPRMPHRITCNYIGSHNSTVSGEDVRTFAIEKLGLYEAPQKAVVEKVVEKVEVTVPIGAARPLGEAEQVMLTAALHREQHVRHEWVRRAFLADDKEAVNAALDDLRTTMATMEALGIEPEPWLDNSLALLEAELVAGSLDRVPARKEVIECPAPRSHTKRWRKLDGRRRSLIFSARRLS